MRFVKVARGRTFFAPGLDELSILGELNDAGIRIAAMSVRHEYVAVRGNRDIARPIECIRSGAGNARLAEGEQHFSLWTELNYDVTLAVFAFRVGDVYIAVAVEAEPVRKNEHPGAEAPEQLAGLIKCKNRIELRIVAACAATTFENPYRAIAIHIDCACRAPRAARWKLRPAVDYCVRVWRCLRRGFGRAEDSECCGEHETVRV